MEIDPEEYKKYSWRSLGGIVFLLNPFLIFAELLGQVFPKYVLVQKRTNSGFIPCEHCDTLHSTLTWTTSNKTQFRNWFGLYCKNCGEIISVNRSLFTWMIIVITYPVWYWIFEDLRQKWLLKQPARFEHLNFDINYHLSRIYRQRGILSMVVSLAWLAFISAVFYVRNDLMEVKAIVIISGSIFILTISMMILNLKNYRKFDRMID